MDLFQLCTGSWWRSFKLSDINDIGIMPSDRIVLCGVVTLNP